ncbi:MAG: hypothetical protein EXR72_11135 [Myxococcales bacterium]|nr:hypothetical protein [Myxococcales bacterium]
MSLPRPALALVFLLLGGGCSQSRRPGGGDLPDGGGCAQGTHRCAGATWQRCEDGVLVPEVTCNTNEVCSDTHGCTPCLPRGTGCDGDDIVRCDENGVPTKEVLSSCLPLTCAMDPIKREATCAGPCDPAALARSNTGCVYYATDLPQWTLQAGFGIGSIAADQQFAISVANPWKVPLDVVVERNDAAPGGTPKLAMVTKKTVAAGGLEVVQLPQREVSGYIAGKKRNRTLLTANAYRVTTTRPASVYQFSPQNNPDSYSNDASLLIPQNALDASYVVLGWPGFGGGVTAGGLHIDTDNRPFVTVVATRAGTKVRVTPSTEVMPGDNVPAMHKGKSYTFNLGEFDTLNLEGADFDKYGATDFTGTRIEANGPLAVWSGVECITINPKNKPPEEGTCCCDHLEEQLFPRSSLGKDYVAVRSEARDHKSADPEFFRILALDDGTEVQTSLGGADHQFTLQSGQMREVVVKEDFTVHSSKALLIGQFQVSQDSSLAGTGDPSFELVPPVAQHRNSYIFLVPSGYGESWLLISILAGGEVTIDGQGGELSGCDRETAGTLDGKSYDALRCPVKQGAHTIVGTAKFGLVVEGWGPGPVSYGYTGGMEFKTVNHDCNMDVECPDAEFCAGGVCVPIIP